MNNLYPERGNNGNGGNGNYRYRAEPHTFVYAEKRKCFHYLIFSAKSIIFKHRKKWRWNF